MRMLRALSMHASGPWPAFWMALAVAALLAIVPHSASLSEAGTGSLGFDPALAHLIVTAAAAVCVLGYALLGHRTEAGVEPATVEGAFNFGLAALVTLVVLLLYFPPFLARYGPYGEDQYFLTALLRIQDGQQPYVDFEFLYGPLLIFGPAAWIDRFGYSLQAYYWLLAVIEALTWAGIVLWLGRRVVEPRARWLAFVVLAALLVNDNLGLSWIAARRILPIATVFVYAVHGERRAGWGLTGALLGVTTLLSLEYAVAAAVSIAAAATLESLTARRWRAFGRAVLTFTAAIVVTGVLATVMMGSAVTAWLGATWQIITLRGGGEAAFSFALSANALVVLALLFLACAWLGSRLRRLPVTGFEAGDRFLVAAVAYAVIALKSGLARSDMYHLVPPLLGIILVVLLPLPFAALAPRPRHRRLALGLVVLLCLTYVPGLAGAGRFWVRGLVLGARDVVTGRPPDGAEPARTRAARLGSERTEQNPDWVPVAEFFASETHADAPVLYYERTWGVDKMIGVPKPRGVYPSDDYLVSDSVGLALRHFLEENTNALVLIQRTAWDHLHDPGTAPEYVSMFWIGRERSLPIRFLEYWSSSHYGNAVVEERIRKRDRWARTVGSLLRDRYTPVAEFSRWLVLGRTGAT